MSEVLAKSNRLSLNGWFHSEKKKELDDDCEMIEYMYVPANDNDYNLNHYFLPNYLEYGNQVQIRTRFVNDSEIQLEEFLIPTFLEEISADLASTKTKWDFVGPANIRYTVLRLPHVHLKIHSLNTITQSHVNDTYTFV